MKYDIVFATFNSERWLEKCVEAIADTNYDLSMLNLIFADNGSCDGTCAKLSELKERFSAFGGFSIINTGKNLGFGGASNAGAAHGCAPYLLFLNVDTCVRADVFLEIDKAICAFGKDYSAFELRQLPFETPHLINPVTLECEGWASAAALVVKREVYAELGGFDSRYFMYGEDVDFSWRIRAAGYKLRYLPFAALEHFTGEKGEAGSLFEYTSIAVSELFLRYKFGNFSQIIQGHRQFFKTLKAPLHFEHVRKVLLKKYILHFLKMPIFLCWRLKNKKAYAAHVHDFATGRISRGCHPLFLPRKSPLVSIIVRTHNRPCVLRQTLLCLSNQTYRHFEVIVAEDGAPTAQSLVENEFTTKLNIKYFASGENVGRSKIGNLALEKSTGEYINFLDDDDFFYPDHIEIMIAQFEQNENADIITAGSMLCEASIVSQSPYLLAIKKLHPIIFERIDALLMCKMSLLSIQSVMFKRRLFLQYGGLDENVDGLEDWSMWLKYFARAKRTNAPGVDIKRATSIYLAPADKTTGENRKKQYSMYEKQILQSNSFTLTAAELRSCYDNLIADIAGMYANGSLESFINSQIGK